MCTAVTGKGKVSKHYLTFVISFFPITWRKWLNFVSWLGKWIFGKNPSLKKAPKVKILAGNCILTSTASWLWGADIIFPQKLLINQKTLSDCQNIIGGDIQSLSNFFSLSTPEVKAAELQTVQCRQQESSRRFCETPKVHELKYGFYRQSMSIPCLFSSNLFFSSS